MIIWKIITFISTTLASYFFHIIISYSENVNYFIFIISFIIISFHY